MKTVKRTWKVYGAEGHRQKMSFDESVKWDFSNPNERVRILEILNADVTGTNEYTVIKITRNSAEECEDELRGQLSDGYFENACVGKVEEIKGKD